MRPFQRLLIATTLTGLVVAACGGGAASQPPAPAEFSVTATEFKFDPATLQVPAGGEVKITLVNGGTIEHDITVDAPAFMVHVNPGETTTGTATFAAGTYDFYCSIPGHKEAGMVGTITAN